MKIDDFFNIIVFNKENFVKFCLILILNPVGMAY